jgi:UDP-N-acetylglucosamine 2-epimerase (non-hydrolysing)
MKKKILIIVGTRPELLKIASLYLDLKKDKNFNVALCVSGQHKSLMTQALNVFKIKPNFLLNLHIKNISLGFLTALISKKVNIVLKKYLPNLVIIHGDTATTYSSAMSAFYLNIPIAHVEAGLRTYDLKNPFPEELYRQVVSRISTFHFAPNLKNKNNLINEKIDPSNIFVTGNTIIDALKLILDKIKRNNKYSCYLKKKLKKILNFNYLKNNFIIVTMHRRENFDTGIKSLCQSLDILSEKYKNYHFIFPVHLNPNVLKNVLIYLKNKKNIHLIKPLKYDLFVYLLKKCKFILTDSGGIQEEAPSLGKPVIVLRKKTERLESIISKNSLLVKPEKINIVKYCERLILNKTLLLKMSKSKNIYGDGRASKKIIKILKKIKL